MPLAGPNSGTQLGPGGRVNSRMACLGPVRPKACGGGWRLARPGYRGRNPARSRQVRVKKCTAPPRTLQSTFPGPWGTWAPVSSSPPSRLLHPTRKAAAQVEEGDPRDSEQGDFRVVPQEPLFHPGGGGAGWMGSFMAPSSGIYKFFLFLWIRTLSPPAGGPEAGALPVHRPRPGR
jgi:hypothetical protein